MIIEFECLKIKLHLKLTSKTLQLQSNQLNYNENDNLVKLNFKKLKEKIYFDAESAVLEFSHAVKSF